MARRTNRGNPDTLRLKLIALLKDFEKHLAESDLRGQVRALVPGVHLLRDLGVSLMPKEDPSSARARILQYLLKYPMTPIAGDELNVVSGISEYARRVRELRVQFGYPIYSGTTARQMLSEEDDEGIFGPDVTRSQIEKMKTDDYILVGDQDRDAAFRWARANEIRRLKLSMSDRLLEYLRANVGHPVTGEELRYVAKKQSWPRRTRELRTELGWPVATRISGRPDLPVGVYVLEADRQSEPHDRNISDAVRVAVLERDAFKCRCCQWTPTARTQGDPRTLLELHHADFHAGGGSNEASNLVTVCNVHHDEIHRLKVRGMEKLEAWFASECG